MTILVKKDSISSKINTVYYVVPASVRAIFIQDFATGEISYKVKNVVQDFLMYNEFATIHYKGSASVRQTYYTTKRT